VVWTDRFKKFLKMVLRLPRLVLEVMLDGYDMLLAGDNSFLIIAIVTGHDSDVLGASFLPLLATLGTYPSAHNGGFGRWCLDVAGGRFRIAQDKGGPVTTSLLEMCWVVTLSSSLVVFG
jgi:hypothetical protein